MNAPQVTEYQDYAEFLAAVAARGQALETGVSNYPGDGGDLHAVVVDHMGGAVGHWGMVAHDTFAGILAPDANTYLFWQNAEDGCGHS